MKKNGQMLIEVVVAVGILALVLVGVSDLMTKSTRTLGYQKDRDEAYSIAREQLNRYREDRDKNLTLSLGPTFLEVCVPGKKYSCRVELLEVVGGMNVKVIVYWTEGVNKFEVSLDQLFVNI